MYNSSNVGSTNSYEIASQTVASPGTMGNRDSTHGYHIVPATPGYGTNGYNTLTNGGQSNSGYSTITTGYGSCQQGFGRVSCNPFSDSQYPLYPPVYPSPSPYPSPYPSPSPM
jgi:hypothetical protein